MGGEPDVDQCPEGEAMIRSLRSMFKLPEKALDHNAFVQLAMETPFFELTHSLLTFLPPSR